MKLYNLLRKRENKNDSKFFLLFTLLKSALLGLDNGLCTIDVKIAKPEGRKAAKMKDKIGSFVRVPIFLV